MRRAAAEDSGGPAVHRLFGVRTEVSGEQASGEPSTHLQRVDRAERPLARFSSEQIASLALLLRRHERHADLGAQLFDARRRADAAGSQFDRTLLRLQCAEQPA
jgi:hypothetical protein